MSHDTHTTGHSTANSSKSSFGASFWLVVILAVLFISAVNFVTVMSHDEGGHGEGHHTEATHDGHDAGHGHETNAPAEEQHH